MRKTQEVSLEPRLFPQCCYCCPSLLTHYHCVCSIRGTKLEVVGNATFLSSKFHFNVVLVTFCGFRPSLRDIFILYCTHHTLNQRWEMLSIMQGL